MSMGLSSIPNSAVKRLHFRIIHFMMEAGVKLNASSIALASAARIYHKFFTHNAVEDFDPYLVSTTSLYLAGKVEEENFRLRDVINVCYRTMYADKPPLDIGSTYWALREAVTQMELLLLRALKFHVSFIHPHKYLLHYIKSLYDWMHPTVVQKFPIGRSAWAILRDSYHGSLCLRYDPEHIAVAALYLALHSYGIEVPSSQDAEYQWWEALVEDLRIERVRRINKEMMEVYTLEYQIAQQALTIPKKEPVKTEPEETKEEEVKVENGESKEAIKIKQEPKTEPVDTSTGPSVQKQDSPVTAPAVAAFQASTIQPVSTPTPPPTQEPSASIPTLPADEDDIYMYLYSEDLKSEAEPAKPMVKEEKKEEKIYVPPLF